MIKPAKSAMFLYRSHFVVAAVCAAVGVSACNPLSDGYSRRLKPLHVVTYASTDQSVLKKRAYFGDGRSNVIVLTDDAQDGFLPDGDADEFVDQIGLEVYERGLLVDLIIRNGSVFQNHLATQKQRPLPGVSTDVLKVLTGKFVEQSKYMKAASARTEYAISLRGIDAVGRRATAEVDGVAGDLHLGVLQKINGVYLMLSEIKDLDSETDSGFAVLQIGNQGVLLKAGQTSRIAVDPAEARESKVTRDETIHFTFVIPDAAPDRESAELEDIFHTFMVDRPDREHVSYYRMVREMQAPFDPPSQLASGVRTVGGPEAEPESRGFLAGLTSNINFGVREFMGYLYGKKETRATIMSFDIGGEKKSN